MNQKKLTPEEIKYCIITKKIKNGDGTERKFDMIDFYLFSSEDPKSFIKNIQDNCTKTELSQIKRFFVGVQNSNGALNNYVTQNSMFKIEYNYKNHCINEQEKNGIILFLQEHNIPIYEATYFGLAKRYIDGFLDLSNYIKNYNVKVKKHG